MVFIMEHFVVGLDGGGTKTAIEMRSLGGRVLLREETDGLNINSHTQEELIITIGKIVSYISDMEGGISSCDKICLSTAGVSNPKAKAFFSSLFREMGVLCEIIIVGDQEGALYGALGKGEGVILISGTGSICYGRNREGISARSGGFGHLIDDEGSGYAIGRDILSQAVKSYDKRIPKSILYDLVLAHIEGNGIEDIIYYTYKSNSSKKDIASLSPLLLEGLKLEDEAAMNICIKASNELATLILTVARELNIWSGEVALLGGILRNYPQIRNLVINIVKEQLPELVIVEAKHDSATGAVLIALDKVKHNI